MRGYVGTPLEPFSRNGALTSTVLSGRVRARGGTTLLPRCYQVPGSRDGTVCAAPFTRRDGATELAPLLRRRTNAPTRTGEGWIRRPFRRRATPAGRRLYPGRK